MVKHVSVNIVNCVGVQPSLTDNMSAAHGVRTPVERMQSFLNIAYESRFGQHLMLCQLCSVNHV